MLRPRYSTLKEAVADFYGKLGGMDRIDERGPGALFESPEHATHLALSDKASKAVADVHDYARSAGIDPHALVHFLPHHHRQEMYGRHKAALDALNDLIQHAQEVQDTKEHGTTDHHEWGRRQHHAYRLKEPHEHAISRYHRSGQEEPDKDEENAAEQQMRPSVSASGVATAPVAPPQGVPMESAWREFRQLAGLDEREIMPWDSGSSGSTKHQFNVLSEAEMSLRARLAANKERPKEPSSGKKEIPPPFGYKVPTGVGKHTDEPEKEPEKEPENSPEPPRERRERPRPGETAAANFAAKRPQLPEPKLKRRRQPLPGKAPAPRPSARPDPESLRRADPMNAPTGEVERMSRTVANPRKESDRPGMTITHPHVLRALTMHDATNSHARAQHSILDDPEMADSPRARERIMHGLAMERVKTADSLRAAAKHADGPLAIKLHHLAWKNDSHAEVYLKGRKPRLEDLETSEQILIG